MAIEIHFSPLMETIYIYDTEKGESYEGKTRYSASLLLTDLGMSECRLHFIQGRLSPEINQEMYRIIRKKGYKRVQLEVPAGTPATRFAKFQYTRDGLDRYIVDIP